jgi:thermitase
MKVLIFTIPVLIAVGMVIAFGAIAEGTLADKSGNIPGYAQRLQVNTPVPTGTSNDPYVNEQWALRQIRALESRQFSSRDRRVLVAVLDTGIDRKHEDLGGKVVAEMNFSDSPVLDDIRGHGTHVAGIIAANSNNGRGITGAAPDSHLLNVKVANDKGRSQTAMVAKGIRWAVDNGASVINISIVFKEPSPGLEKAIDYAWSRGAVIVSAAGNRGNQLPIYPAYYENSIAVAATREDETLAPLSNHGDWVDMAAPGFNIYSTLPGNGYGYKSGTSFATAHVSGLAALLFGIATDTDGNGRLNDEVRAAIESGCQDIAISGVGAGLIDIVKSTSEINYTP